MKDERSAGSESVARASSPPDTALHEFSTAGRMPALPYVPVRINQSGTTFIELLVVIAILLILSAIVLPVARFSIQRERELELRRSLRILRDAIDAYHEAAMPTTPGAVPKIQVKFGTDGWPLTLEALVEGETVIGDVSGKKMRFLRRIPKDPIANGYEWGLRSTQDEPDSTAWGGENIWDVYCKARILSLDGVTYYNEW